MFKRNTISAFIFSTVAVAALCLLAGVIAAQKRPNSTTGAPIGGIDIKLGKNPGGSAAERTFTTGDDGKINFGALPKDSYYLIVTRIPQATLDARSAATNKATEVDAFEVTIKGAVGGDLVMNWDPKLNKAYKPAKGATSRTTPNYQDKIIFELDGKTECHTKVKSCSNVKNN